MSSPLEAHDASSQLSREQVQHLSRLARLRLSVEETERFRTDLARVLDYADRLRSLPTEGVDPLVHIGELHNRLDDDRSGHTLDASTVESLAPHVWHGYLRVPKVLAEGGGA